DVLATVRRHVWGGLTFQTSASHPDLCLVPRSDLTRLLQAACYRLKIVQSQDKERPMAKKARDKLSTPAEEALKRQKKQARQEAKLMLEIEVAKKQLKNAQKKQSKAQTLVEAQSAYVQSLEARLAELRASVPE